MTSRFLNLPVELLLYIFSYLSPQWLLLCRYTCCRLCDIILGDRLLQQKIQDHCMKDYLMAPPSSDRLMIDCSLVPSSSATSDFLRNLEEMEMTGSTFGPRDDVSMRTEFEPFQSFHKFEIYGYSNVAFLLRSGYLIRVHIGWDSGWSYMNLSPKHDLKGYTPALEWRSVHFKGPKIVGWAIDLGQDLMAVSLEPDRDSDLASDYFDPRVGCWKYCYGSIKILLLRFTNGRNHKSANKAVIRLDPLGSNDMKFKTHIAIMGGYLVVLVTFYDPHKGFGHIGKHQTRYFVDWVNGHVIHKRQVIDDTYFPFLASISENTFVMGLRREWALELCEITEKNGCPRIRRRRRLKLPAVQADTHILLEKFDETSCTGRLRFPWTFPSRAPPSDSVLAFNVAASSRSGEKQTLFFSVLTSTLYNFTVATRTSRWLKRTSRGPFIVPWNDWGPESTRWINIKDFSIRALSGARCVISETSTGRVRMLDFNPERLPWMEDWVERRNGETGRWDCLAMIFPTTILAGEVFQCNIESKLPYYEIKKTGVKAEAGFRFFVDDKWVVLIQEDPRYLPSRAHRSET